MWSKHFTWRQSRRKGGAAASGGDPGTSAQLPRTIVSGKRPGHAGHLSALVLALATAGLMASCSGYDLDEKQMDNAGRSLYEYLQSAGSYTNYTRLIDDLGEKESLTQTNLRTLFVGDDDAFARFYANNTWGVHRYEDLSPSQKKMLLYGSMLANSYQVFYLSSSEGPTEGNCMRRSTESTAFDTVPLIHASEMPSTPFWSQYKDAGKDIYCMKDFTTTPIIHFTEKQLVYNKITNDDYNFLMNYSTERKSGDASINGIPIVEQNIRCMNGFVHRMAEVITPLPNMAEKIRQLPRTSLYSTFLERFCAPFPLSKDQTKAFNTLYGTNADTVYQKRYFSDISQDYSELALAPDKSPAPAMLKYDPGWNGYYPYTVTTSKYVAMQENMGVMLVPTNKALQRYWDNEGGRVLKDYYGSWDRVPDEVISKLVNVNMLSSFKSSVPSKFVSVLDDANNYMGIQKGDIDSVYMCCNGAIYMTNKVFSPTIYRSVSFPALINDNMKIIYWAIGQLEFDAYLNSMVSYYSFLIPTNDDMLQYVDPVSYGKVKTQLFRFRYDAKAQTVAGRVKASIWNYDPDTHEVGDSLRDATSDEILDRLEDILDSHIIVGNIENGNTYFKTKGGSVVKVAQSGGAGTMELQGGRQIEQGTTVKVSAIYDESSTGNGKSYILEGEPIQTCQKTVYSILSEHPEFSKFLELLEGSGYLETVHKVGNNTYACGGTNMGLFNSFNYTVYVPTNESIQKLQDDGLLPTWDYIEGLEDEDPERARLTEIVNKFIRYHIQDNSIFIGQGDVEGNYETQVMNAKGKFDKVTVKANNNSLTVTDLSGNTRTVQKVDGLYNQMAREYQYNSSDVSTASQINTSSTAVVHLIDGPLFYDEKNQFK
jgi:hypothetical protein